jgi:DNA-binding SARP family transcriptional activator
VIDAENRKFAVHLFGTPQVCVEGTPVVGISTRQGDRLLACLVLAKEQTLPSDPLAERLWPETGSHDSLHHCVQHLRQAFKSESGRLQSARGKLTLDVSDAFVDVLAFQNSQVQEDTDALEAALALYKRGTLLDGWENETAVWKQNETWILRERSKVKEKSLQISGQLIRLLCVAGQNERALKLLRPYVMARPQEEWAWCAWMQALVASDDRLEARKIYDACRDFFQENALPPPPEMTRLLHQIQAGIAPASRSRISHSGDTTSSPYREPVGGAVPLNSSYYVERPADQTFQTALERRDSIVLVKGPRQTGKTSLLTRGLQHGRETGATVALTDLQKLNAAQLASADTFYLALAQSLADQLELDAPPHQQWDTERTANANFERYLRRVVLPNRETSLVWGLDEVDRLFPCPYSGEVFALFRSWHNERSFDPNGPWSRLTLAIAYATEAHLFITDLNQSPFNVGTRLTLDDFTPAQIDALNAQHDNPLQHSEERQAFLTLVGGCPYLVRRGLYEMATRSLPWADFAAQAVQEEGCYGDHLRHLKQTLMQDAELCAAVRELLQGRPCPTSQSFYRLRSAGLLAGPVMEAARFRCALYRRYLETHLL